jgi:hypothetical protein
MGYANQIIGGGDGETVMRRLAGGRRGRRHRRRSHA